MPLQQCKKIYNSKKTKKLERGIAFPTCISVNHICGHYSPLKEESFPLKEGDVVKIDLGSHIDGYVAQAATTVVCRANKQEKVSGKKADVIAAAHTALQAAIRTFRAEKTNFQVTEMIKKSAEAYETQPLDAVFSSKQKKHLIDTNDTIANRYNPEHKVEKYTFAPGDVFYLDILISTGEGKAKESEYRTTVYKRSIENTYLLKIQSSRKFFSEVNAKFPTLPFSLRALEDQTAAKVGLKECLSHDLISAYPVVIEREGELVAQFKATVALTQSRVQVLSGDFPLDSAIQSEHKVTDQELLDTLAVALDKKS